MLDLVTDDPVDLLVSRVFKVATVALDRALASEAIGYRQWLVLSLIDDEPGITARDIGERLCHDTGALSRIVEFLSEHGLVARDRCTEDRRIVRLRVTTTGADSARRGRRKVAERRDDWRRRLSVTEQMALASALTKLAEAIGDGC